MRDDRPNKAQEVVIHHDRGELLVVAGAGTGKTKTIVDRVAKLIEKGIDKKEILALTFTEKAAHEMLDRVSDTLKESYGVEIAIHTFNAFGQLLIEEFATEIGLSSRQKLVGEDGQVVFMREHIDSFVLDYFAPAPNPDNQLVTLADYFSELKQQLVTPEKYMSYAKNLPESDTAERLEKKKHTELANAYETYIKIMRQANVIDYDDQIYLAIEILEKRPNILARLQERYRHIMVDEFQDTNPMQSRLIDLIYKRSKSSSLVVVGDDDQAIYEWRGATLANILDFTKRYPKAEKVALITNYRNTQKILDCAWKLIQHNNPERLEVIEELDKKLISKKGSGETPAVYQFETQQEELYYVAEHVKQLSEQSLVSNQSPSVAVLTRSRRLTKQMHDVLHSMGVEHIVAGLGEDLYKQKIVVMMLDALASIWQPKNASAALYHTLTSKLFSCDPVLLAEMAHDAKSKHLPLYTALESLENNQIQRALTIITELHRESAEHHVRTIAYKLLEKSGLKDTLYKNARLQPEAEREVLTLAKWFESLQDFEAIATTPSVFSYLENLSVLKAEGEILDDTADIIDGLPIVMTMHKSKGLEWDSVFVIGANERSFPYLGGGSTLKIPDELRLSARADSRINEERRLMYVAATRARRQLVITHSKTVHGGKMIRKPSRFIDELGLSSTDISNDSLPTDLETHLDAQVVTPVGLPKKLIDGEYITLTASQAEDYLHCPLNFYYKHVLSVPDITGPEAEVGSLIHAIIQKINESKKNKIKPPEKSLLLSQLQKGWPERGYASRKQRDKALKDAINAFGPLYERLVSESVPLAVEESFRVKIPNSSCILQGRFDAVITHDEGVEIHDYKTNTSVSDEEKAKNKVKSSEQLTMYAVAWRIMNGQKPDSVALDYVLTGQVGRMKKQDKSLDTMENKLATIAEKIKAFEFPAGQKHDYCIHPL